MAERADADDLCCAAGKLSGIRLLFVAEDGYGEHERIAAEAYARMRHRWLEALKAREQ